MESELLDFIQKLCNLSEKNILKYYDESYVVQTKSDLSPVTIADQTTEEILRNEISKQFPHHSILGEEFGLSGPKEAEYQWVLDPIDGTKSFIHKIPLFGTLIAVLKNNEPFIGCINNPCLKDRMIGVINKGTTLNGVTVKATPCDQLQNACLSTTCIKSSVDLLGKNFLNLTSQTKYSRTWGDCYGHLMVAAGKIDIMVDPILNLWDIAALKPCVEGAGAAFFDLTGKSNGLGNMAISCSPQLKDPILKILNDGRN